ncbi:nitrite reductase small subunit NirD [Williamsia sp. CHRR-6]|uniref:nitrite reductase small subunit NirD n=1 Tax=Williamsia sp. CHRR-6 TaxID=2835871 RepID=UPI001BDB49BE|nr:nitrite reductase small subunit NirD [Williamsia sp. CHRR-6]MBT0565642.1 nitrite reductase small subunit NirD [Williamsia sp. CHRR-6]
MTVIDQASSQTATQWTPACPLSELIPGRGVAVLLPGFAQAALFRMPDDTLYAVGNIDPFGPAAVISRGLVGDRAGEPVVASPLLKQVFSLRTGVCLDDDRAQLGTFAVRLIDGVVEIAGDESHR